MHRPLVISTCAFIAGIVSIKYKIALIFIIFGTLLLVCQIFYRPTIRKACLIALYLSVLFSLYAFGKYKGISIKEISDTEKFYTSNSCDYANITCIYDELNIVDGNLKIKAKIISLEYNDFTFKPTDEYIYIYDNKSKYQCGDIVNIKGLLYFYSKPRNPGEFDLKSYYLTRNIVGYITPVKSKIISHSTGISNSCKNLINKSKNYIVNNLKNNLNSEDAGVVISIITGDRSYLENDIRSIYQKAGFAHVLAISGLHISIIIMGLYMVLRKLGMRMHYATAAVLIVALLFTYFVDEPVSCKRAVIMLSFALIARIVGRRYDGLSAISFAALIILINQPSYIYDSSFLLTFSAGLGIIFMTEVKNKTEILVKYKLHKRIISNFIFALGFQMFMIPVSVQFYYSFSPYAIVLNIVLLPLMSFLLILGILLGLTGGIVPILGKCLAYPLSFILYLYKTTCNLVGKLPFNEFVTGKLNLVRWLIAIAILILFVALVNKYKRLLCFVIVIPYFMILSPSLYRLLEGQNTPQIAQLYVGQGDCSIIFYKENVIAIDMGSSDNEDLYERCIMNYLHYCGYDGIDYAFISHGDYDHSSALYELLEKDNHKQISIFIPRIVDRIGFEKLYESKKKNSRVKIKELDQYDNVNLGALDFTVLYPDEAHNDISENDSSMVLYCDYKGYNALFMGDLSEEYEAAVVEGIDKCSLNRKINYYKVGHHGSKYSTGEQLLNELDIENAVISVGERNFYGHPHEELLNRLTERNIKVLRTDTNGAVIVEMKR